MTLTSLTRSLHSTLAEDVLKRACGFAAEFANARTAQEARAVGLIGLPQCGVSGRAIPPLRQAPWWGWCRLASWWVWLAHCEKTGEDPWSGIDEGVVEPVHTWRPDELRARELRSVRGEFLSGERKRKTLERLEGYERLDALRRELVDDAKRDLALHLSALGALRMATPLQVAALGIALFRDVTLSYWGSRQPFTFQSKLGRCPKPRCRRYFFGDGARGWHAQTHCERHRR